MVDQEDIALRARFQLIHWEEAIVKDILRSGNRLHEIDDLRSINLERLGHRDLRLDAFYTLYPDYPFPIYPALQRHIQQPTFDEICNRFTKTVLYRVYLESLFHHDLDPIAQPLAVVFEMPAIGRCVIHNMTGLHNDQFWIPSLVDEKFEKHPRQEQRGFYLIRTLGCPPVSHVIEKFDTLLELATDWGHRQSKPQPAEAW